MYIMGPVIEKGTDDELAQRVQRYAALADAGRLAIIDELLLSDRTPTELGRLIGAPSNLLAHHLYTLESAGLIGRSRSSNNCK